MARSGARALSGGGILLRWHIRMDRINGYIRHTRIPSTYEVPRNTVPTAAPQRLQACLTDIHSLGGCLTLLHVQLRSPVHYGCCRVVSATTRQGMIQ